LTKTHPKPEELPLINVCLNYLAFSDERYHEAVQFAEEQGATPNQSLLAAVSMMGDMPDLKNGKLYISAILDLLTDLGIKDKSTDMDFDKACTLSAKHIPKGKKGPGTFAKMLMQKMNDKFNKSNILQFALRYVGKNKVDDHDLFLMAALFVDLAFDALVLKKISRSTVESMIEYLGIESRMLILSGINTDKNKFLTQLQKREDLVLLETSFTEVAYRVVFQQKPDATQLKEFQALLALTLTNGVGTISAKGAKESVSARNNIATAFGGFLVNTGLAHGGAGFEAIEFLLDAFKGTKLKDPAVLPAKTNLKDISNTVAINYLEFKQDAKQKGLMSYKRIPCINHPVFKGKPVNIDPREDYIYNYFKKLGIGNIFWDFYHDLVHSLFENGVSANVYCVNIDAVIAVISLKLMWGDFLKKKISDKEMQKIGFIIFLLGRMAGVSAEIADHRDRGQDMDTRTPVSETKFVV